MTPSARSRAFAAALLAAAACSAPGGPVDPAFLASLAELARETAADAPYLRRTAHLVIDTAELDTEVSGVAIVSTRGEPRAALQLLPAVGPKLLDLRFDGATLHARWPPTGRELAWDVADGPAPRTLEVLLTASLLEHDGRLDVARVRAARATRATRAALVTGKAGTPSDAESSTTGGGWLELAPRLDDVRVEARVDAEGRVLERRYRHRGVTWTETKVPGGRRFTAKDVSIVVLDERVEPLEAVPENAFRLAP